MIINQVNEAAETKFIVLKKVITIGKEVNIRGILINMYSMFIMVTLFAYKIALFIGDAFL